ncbi:MAG TPA: hypothetical protein VLS48_02430, partial [Anaerolineales bacterium]|nr:hypothetical protein [Anaerolineales bacterium]
DDMRIVLTWNATEKWSVTPEVPNDLDANLWVPADPLPVRIYWDAPYNCESTAFPSACLEFDVQNGYGPETILIQEQRLGVYHYAVFNYGAALAADYGIPQVVPPIQQLDALVQVYDSKGLLQEFRVEEAVGAGWWWHVFDIDAVSNPGVLIPVNVVTNEPPVPMLMAQLLGRLDFLRK